LTDAGGVTFAGVGEVGCPTNGELLLTFALFSTAGPRVVVPLGVGVVGVVPFVLDAEVDVVLVPVLGEVVVADGFVVKAVVVGEVSGVVGLSRDVAETGPVVLDDGDEADEDAGMDDEAAENGVAVEGSLWAGDAGESKRAVAW